MLHSAWILHRRAYRESSLLLSLFTRERGRVDAVARGARRSTSRHRGLLQPFTPLRVELAGRGPLHALVAAEADRAGVPLQGDNLLAGFYLNELLLRLLGGDDPQEFLWNRYADTVQALAGAASPGPLLRRFERELLDALGYGLNLECDIATLRPLDAAREYRYVLEEGPSPLPEGTAAGPLCFSGQTLIDIRENRYDSPATRQAARRLLGAALALYLGDAPLKSRQVLVDLYRFEDSAPAH